MSTWLIPLIVGLAAPISAFAVVAWKLSGRITTSEASILWQEATVMREEYKKRAQECERRVDALRNELQTAVARNTALARELRELRGS